MIYFLSVDSPECSIPIFVEQKCFSEFKLHYNCILSPDYTKLPCENEAIRYDSTKAIVVSGCPLSNDSNY
jgi:hypothetical protein